jgi:mRNA-degrading endonuclease RelE of RelBE toxin-antitoxin system
MVDVVFTSAARDQAAELPRAVMGRVGRLLERLKQWPAVSGAKPLTGKLAGRFRLRTGDYRVQFRVEGKTVIVEKIGHRDRFYGVQ